MNNQVQQAKEVFEQKFGTTPVLFFSPGRINLIGEHVDYNNGFVMPAAIDKGVVFAIAPNNTSNIRVYSIDMKEDLEVALDQVAPKEGWANYILGVVDQFQKRGAAIKGFDVAFGGNLPAGAGLSSSAAVECGLASGLNTIFNIGLNRVEIALLSQKAEHTFPGVKCGIMDQFANMMGEKDHVLLLDCDTMEYKALPLQLQGHVIMLINSKVHHSLASGEYNVRRQQCETGLAILQQLYPGTKTFRDITPEQVQQAEDKLDKDVFRRCLFVTQEIQRTQKAAALLQENKLPEFGQLMFATHEGLSKLYDVSCPELDFLVEQAKEYKAILGSRLMGGGFGGCTINIVAESEAKEIGEKISEAYKKHFNITPEVYIMQTGNGTYEVK
ncbi:galactokinase [Filimonas lacunae]|uniref:Galactokinase n=1 Tax=Filimonas lacunae TaxID=477680 RepID=A0A173MNI3_9BACT|nr:galactokinase [Filimonas lacunae]BAV09203.1 galactokinase [Filimonas lacunae]SIS68883.1 galactokinase [Filimonas lacunae]